ncbi:zinc-ribbon domain-containing protein [Halorussus limi]|uniref:Zinc-ribbon domain-containing protein n=1 Tax=Halorussus limi TaxID=2938695 RepID=A0A8U0HQD8_9EURY|nr:zinc-ribbon domain-containing protein [Halorussus limi]UPV73255.1 zinc-ribbon domain-containing protein [Halorussus limi]
MTNSDSPTTDDAASTDAPSAANEPSATDVSSAESPPETDDTDRAEELQATVAALTDRVAQLERAVTWMARQQAAETGNSVCPECNTGGALRVSRSPTGKKQVKCKNCGEKIN